MEWNIVIIGQEWFKSNETRDDNSLTLTIASTKKNVSFLYWENVSHL